MLPEALKQKALRRNSAAHVAEIEQIGRQHAAVLTTTRNLQTWRTFATRQRPQEYANIWPLSEPPRCPASHSLTFQTRAPQELHISYLPLAHVFETVVINYCIFCGAAIGFYQGNTLKILEDLQALRPTIFVSVPRLYTRYMTRS